MPANGWWHEWTFNYDVNVENDEVHLDIAEREAKILVYRGENWQPSPPAPVSETPSNEAFQNQQGDAPTDQNPPQSTQSEKSSQ